MNDSQAVALALQVGLTRADLWVKEAGVGQWLRGAGKVIGRTGQGLLNLNPTQSLPRKSWNTLTSIVSPNVYEGLRTGLMQTGVSGRAARAASRYLTWPVSGALVAGEAAGGAYGLDRLLTPGRTEAPVFIDDPDQPESYASHLYDGDTDFTATPRTTSTGTVYQSSRGGLGAGLDSIPGRLMDKLPGASFYIAGHGHSGVRHNTTEPDEHYHGMGGVDTASRLRALKQQNGGQVPSQLALMSCNPHNANMCDVVAQGLGRMPAYAVLPQPDPAGPRESNTNGQQVVRALMRLRGTYGQRPLLTPTQEAFSGWGPGGTSSLVRQPMVDPKLTVGFNKTVMPYADTVARHPLGRALTGMNPVLGIGNNAYRNWAKDNYRAVSELSPQYENGRNLFPPPR